MARRAAVFAGGTVPRLGFAGWCGSIGERVTPVHRETSAPPVDPGMTRMSARICREIAGVAVAAKPDQPKPDQPTPDQPTPDRPAERDYDADPAFALHRGGKLEVRSTVPV